MTKRLYTTADLDVSLGQTVEVDCDEGFFRNAVLVAVFKGGKFELALEDGKTNVTVGPIHNGMTKVFLA